jgi:hypothetical protein
MTQITEKTTKKSDASKEVGLEVNAEKSKCSAKS